MNRTGIIGAMEIEVARLKEMMTEVTVVRKASMEFNVGMLNGKPVSIGGQPVRGNMQQSRAPRRNTRLPLTVILSPSEPMLRSPKTVLLLS